MATDYTINANCKLAYLLYEGSGTTTSDWSGHSNVGTFSGGSGHPAWSSVTVPSFGISGTAPNSLVSDATSLVLCGASSNPNSLFNSGQSLTLSCWIYKTSNYAYNDHLFDIGSNMRLGTNFTDSSNSDLYF